MAAGNSSQADKDSADFVGDGTNDQNAINAAIAALPAAGGSVVLLDGTYNISNSINLGKSNVTLSGQGSSTILNRNFDGASLINITTSNQALYNFAISGNKATFTSSADTGIYANGYQVGNVTVQYVDISNTAGDSIVAGGSANPAASNILDNKIINSGAQGISSLPANSLVEGNTVNGASTNGIRVGGANTQINDNDVSASASGIFLDQSSGYSVVSGNIITGNSTGLLAWSGPLNITGNSIDSNTSNGLELNGVSYSSNSNNVNGNQIYNNGGNGIVFSGNHQNITGNFIASNTQDGINISSCSSNNNNIISGNTLENNGGGGSYSSIDFNGCQISSNNIITDNTITNNAGTGYAIYLNAATNDTYLSNNTYSGTGASSIYDQGTGTIYANQADANGNLILRSQGGEVNLGGNTASASLVLQGSEVISQLPAPTAPTVTANTTGTTTYGYKITALGGMGETTPSTETQITNGAATANNTISWSAVGGAVQYRVYRTTGGATQGLLATVSGNVTSYVDNNATATTAPPTTNTTGNASIANFLGINNTNPANRIAINSVNTSNATTQAAQELIGTGSASNVGLVIQGSASQTGDLLDLQNSSGTKVAGVTAGGTINGTGLNICQGVTCSAGNVIAGANGSDLYVQNIAYSYGLRVDAGSNNGELIKGPTANNGVLLTLQSSSGTQTGDNVQVKDSSGNVLSRIDNNGSFIVNLGIPPTPSITASTSGGSLAANTYYYKVTALDAAGNETTPSTEVSITTTSSTSSVSIGATTPYSVSGASTYRIYRGTSAGGENVYYTTSSTNFVDTGAASTAGTPPSTNNAKFDNLTVTGTSLNGGYASGSNSLAFGSGSHAAAISDIAIGANSYASGSNYSAVALGSGAYASAGGSIALGSGATASNQHATAIGSATANGYGAVAIGDSGQVQASGSGATAIGSSCISATGANAIALGTGQLTCIGGGSFFRNSVNGGLTYSYNNTTSTLYARGGASYTGPGTVSTSSGSATVTGSNTTFTNDFTVGDRITVGTETYTVIAIANDTLLTVSSNFVNSNSSVSYTVLPSIFKLQDASGTPVLFESDQGNLGLGTNTPGARLQVVTNGAGGIGQIIQGSASQTADLLQVQNNSGTVLDKIDSAGNILVQQVSPPTLNTPTASTSGGSLTTNTYYYEVTAIIPYVTGNGETVASNEKSIAVTGPTGSVSLTWSQVNGAMFYRIYRGTTSGGENVQYSAQGQYSTSFTDTGAAGSAASPPVTSTAYNSALSQSGYASVFNSGVATTKISGNYQGGNLLVTSNYGNTYFCFEGGGLNINDNTCGNSSTGLVVNPRGYNNRGEAIQGLSGQTADLLDLQDYNGNVNAAFNANGNQLTLGRISTSGTVTQGQLSFADGTTDGYAVTLQGATQTAGSATLTIPNLAGTNSTICIQGSGACGFATGSGAAFVQNGNAFGATAVLGTTDNNGINIEANNTVVASFSNTGNSLFKNSSNSSTAFQVQTTSGSSLLNVNTSGQQININQLVSPSGLSANLLNAPTGVSVTSVGSSGTTSYSYVVSATLSNGYTTAVSATANISSGNSILTTGNYNSVSWATLSGAVSYNIYRTVANGTSPTSTGFIGSTTSNSFNDTGLAASIATPNNASLSNSTTYYYKVTAIDSTGGETTASGEISQSSGSISNQAIALTWNKVSGARAYRIYRGTSPGAENVFFVSSSNNFIDYNTANSTSISGTPTFNTAYSTSLSNINNSQQLTLGSFGSTTAQLYVGSSFATPLSVTPVGATGSSPWSYEVIGVDSKGNLLPGPYSAGETDIGNSTLSSSNYNQISWSSIPGAVSYNVYRTGNFWVDLSLGLIGNTTGTTFNDTGLTATGTPPSSAVNSYSTSSGHNISQAIVGNFLYILNGSCLLIFNITNSSSPILVNQCFALPSNSQSIFAQSGYLYLAANNGIYVYNVANPSQPSLLGEANSQSGVSQNDFITVQGRYAYVGNNGYNNINATVYDISNPSNPYIFSSINTGSGSAVVNIITYGQYLFILNAGGTAELANISNPSSPVVNYLSPAGLAGGYKSLIGVSGSYLYVEAADNTMKVIDISNLSDPVVAGSISLPANGLTGQIDGRVLYAFDPVAGIFYSIDISSPQYPQLVGAESTGQATNNGSSGYASFMGRYAYTAQNVIYPGYTLYSVFDLGGAYTQSLHVGQSRIGNLSVDNNALVSGQLNVSTGLFDGGSAQISGDLGVTGSENIQGSLETGGGIQGGLVIAGLPTPSAPTISPQGTTGSSGYSYVVVAVSANGSTTPASLAGSTTSGNSVLNSTNYNTVSWTTVAGAVTYYVYRTVSGGTTPTTTGLIGTTSSNSFNDTGVAGNGAAASSLDTSGQLYVKGIATFKDPTSSATAFQIQNSAGSNVLNIDTNTQTVSAVSISAPVGVTASLLNAVSTPTVTPSGTTGSTNYSYSVVAITGSGLLSAPSTAGTTSTGNATLSTSSTNSISWSAVSGAIGYNVYRTVAGGSSPTTTGFIGYTTGTSFSDTNITATGTTPASATLSNNTTYYYKITALDSQGGESTASSEVSQASGPTSNQAISLAWTPVSGARSYRIYRGTSSGAENTYFTSTRPSFIDYNTASSYAGSVTTAGNAYASNLSNGYNGQLTVGSAGTASGQIYVGGNLAPPVTVTTVGTPGSTLYSYVVVGVSLNGTTLSGPYSGGLINVGNAALSSSNYNSLSWPIMPGAASYNIYRMGTNTADCNVNCLIGTTTSTSFSDTGQAGTSGVPPSSAIGNVPLVSTSGFSAKVLIQGRYAYVADNASASTTIINTTNNAAPVRVANIANVIPGAISGNYLYGYNTSTGQIVIYDVSNPSIPALVDSMTVSGGYESMTVQGSYLYEDYNNGLNVYNISNPASAKLVYNTTFGNAPRQLLISGNYLYTTSQIGTIIVFNISNPSSPVQVTNFNFSTTDTVTNIYFQSHYLYAISGYALYVFDLSNPISPTLLSTLSLPGEGGTEPFSVAGNYLYVSIFGGNGAASFVQVIDISNAYNPYTVSYIPVSFQPTANAVMGRYLYLESMVGGRFQVFDLGGTLSQNLEVGSAEVGTLGVDSAATIQGVVNANSGLQVSGSALFNGNVGVNGSLSVGGTTNSTTAFQVQNAGGGTILSTDTTANTLNVSGNINLNQVAAPTTAPTLNAYVASGALTGTYYYVVSYVTASGTTNYGPVSAAVSPSAQNVQLNIPTSPSNLVTARNIYRSTVSGGPYNLVGIVNDNITTTFTDNNTSPSTTALDYNTTGTLEVNGSPILIADNASGNTALGISSLLNNSSGYSNTAIGNGALQSNSTGHYNTSTGYQSLQANTGGNYNTSNGFQALENNSTGSGNTSIGTSSMQNNSSGYNNTAVGESALYNNATGYQNTALGYYAGYQDSNARIYSGANIQNATAIGAYAQVQASSTLVLGSVDTPTQVVVGATIGIGTNLFGVSPVIDNSSSAGCSVASSTSTTCLTSGTSPYFYDASGFGTATAGDIFISSDGQHAIVTSIVSSDWLVFYSSLNYEPSNTYFRLHVPGFQVQNNGDAYVQGVNSTTAFQLLGTNTTNGNSLPVLTADTTNNRIQIGSSTANTNGIVLVLNNYNAAIGTEPSEVDGAMYYNSTLNQFRCGIDGSWQGCSGLAISNTTTAACTISTTATACAPNNYYTGTTPTIPANYCIAGRTIHLHATGIYTGVTAASNITFSVRLGTTIVGAASPALADAIATNQQWAVDFWISCDSTTTVTGEGTAQLFTSSTANSFGSMVGTSATTVTNTSAQAIALYINVGTAADFSSITMEQFMVHGM
ncbi:MAG TPA: hypothetical protein VFN56_05355 [Candidatus Saccharimonadales bacterium]|nr:hypothetical protein [Candidatus Saccharimonadales bacterium]